MEPLITFPCGTCGEYKNECICEKEPFIDNTGDVCEWCGRVQCHCSLDVICDTCGYFKAKCECFQSEIDMRPSDYPDETHDIDELE